MKIDNKYILNAFSEMSGKKEIYRSSKFWEEACKNITENIIKNGLKNFRKDILNLHFFVPTYGSPGNSFREDEIAEILKSLEKTNKKNKLTLEGFFKGELSALSDFRVFKSNQHENDLINLLSFSEGNFGNPKEQFIIEDGTYSRSSLNYLLGLSFLKKSLPKFNPKIVLEIGGGFGTLGEILGKIPNQKFKYIDLDLPPIFIIASEYIKNTLGTNKNNHFLYDLNDSKDVYLIKDLPEFSFFPSWEIEKLRGKIDLFVNFISFQEMEPEIVKNYLFHVNRLDSKVILLRNMREGKQKASTNKHGVKEPVFSEDYLKFLPNYRLHDKNIHPFGYKTVDGFHSELQIFIKK